MSLQRLVLPYVVLVALSVPQPGIGSTETDSIARYLAERFTPLTEGGEPGFAVGVIGADGALVEGYFGLADLELDAGVGTHSRFYIGSVSKQFTAALAALLILEDRLDLTDRVGQYVEDWPEVHADVRVGDLIFHTSGLREYTSLMLIRGDDRSLQDRMTTEDALRLIKRQRGLNFPPGTQYRYSSSGYVVLTEVIERIEGASLRDVAARRLFEPLGMRLTEFDDHHWRVVPGRVQSYQPAPEETGETWKTWLKHFDVVGDGGLLTTIRDLATWERELRTGATFGPAWRDLMHTPGRLRDGATLDYAFGLQRTRIEGRDAWYHGGGMGGFISDQIRLVEPAISIYVLANRNDASAFQGWALARDLIRRWDDAPPERVTETPDAESTGFRPNAAERERLGPWLASYFSDSINDRRAIGLNERGELVLRNAGRAEIARLESLGDDVFRTDPGGNRLTLTGTREDPAFEMVGATYRYSARRFDPTPPAASDDLQPLLGRYSSEELNADFELRNDHGRIVFRHAGLPAVEVFPSMNLANGEWNGTENLWTGVMMIRFQRGPDGRVIGAEVGDGRVTGVPFRRDR